MTPQIFQNQFFSRSLHQAFNTEVMPPQSDENESALHKWLVASGKLH